MEEAQKLLAEIINTQRGEEEPQVQPDDITKDGVEGYTTMSRDALEPADLSIQTRVHQGAWV